MIVEISGFAVATGKIDDEQWEEMSEQERREWAYRHLKRGTIADVSTVTNQETGEEIFP